MRLAAHVFLCPCRPSRRVSSGPAQSHGDAEKKQSHNTRTSNIFFCYAPSNTPNGNKLKGTAQGGLLNAF